ncbi:hypothetical protein L207DRAFT_630183 [Hyaloscypha variabilis F]|uniref:2EXR domain-containing protein n=1 Tax=Hyaloscypha variabilis (strain UAMH 11265 / GT02V1 / F) TaxID=1149755 RepID=A0A2J6S4V5_HYAVF|nr:hypothetical protein L207DRAFT_630183 [Hyaloscypha variabilis F]
MPRGRSKKKTPARPPILALSEFQLFPKLLAEIRRMVWSVVIPGQRAIRVVPHRPSKTATKDGTPTYRLRYGPRYFMDHIPTVLLHICKESRTFALERYKPFLGSPCGDLPIYFDFEGDTLFFNSNLEWKFMTDISDEEREAEKKEVLRLAAVVDAMMNELAWHQSSGLDNWSVSSDGEAAPENGSSDDGTADDNGETDGSGYDVDKDSLFGDGGDGAFDSGIACDNDEAEEREIYGDLDSLFGEGKYATRSGGVPYGRNDDGNWDDCDFLDGNSKTKVPEVKKWKEQLRFIALGGETCPNHESLAPFTAVLKVTIERGRAFGLMGLMNDHLLQVFKKGRRAENSAELPIIQFVNQIA